MIQFDAATHTYRLRGRVIPSVTQILDRYSDFSRVPPRVLERKRLLGTAVHTTCELYDRNDLDESSLNQELTAYLSQYVRFLEESKFVVENVEQRVWSDRYGYAGTLDRTGHFPNSGRALLDLKTAAAVCKTYGPQTAAYELALKEREAGWHEPIERRYCLLLSPASYKLCPMDNPRDQGVFLAALTMEKYLNDK